MFIDDSLAKAKLRDIYRESQDGQLRFVNKYLVLVTKAGKNGVKKRTEKLMSKMALDIEKEYGQLSVGSLFLRGKPSVFFSSYAEPIVTTHSDIGNVTQYHTYTAASKNFIKNGLVINLAHKVMLHEHFILRTLQRVKGKSLNEALGIGMEVLKAVSKYRITYKDFPESSYVIVDDYAVPLDKIHTEHSSGALLKTVLVKNRMTPSQLGFFGDAFNTLEKTDAKLVIIDKSGDIVCQLNENEYGSGTLYQDGCDDLDPTFINDYWSRSIDFFEKFVTYSSLSEDDKKKVADNAMSKSDGIVFLTKTKEFGDLVEGSKERTVFGSKIKNR